jgi:mannosyltransferase OCH1-like enzyme
MIPKKIHYCWFGSTPLPNLTIKCIESWKKYLPEYEIIQWNEKNFDINSYLFTKEAYKAKKYAFVADVCRLEVLNKYGGIYLDTDMEILKPLNIISSNFIVGFEDSRFVGVGIIISPAKNKFIEAILDIYNVLTPIEQNCKWTEFTIPKIITKELVARRLILNDEMQILEDSIIVYPSDYFYPLNFFSGKLGITERTLGIHHYESSWMTAKQKIINKVKILLIIFFGVRTVTKLISKIKGNAVKENY